MELLYNLNYFVFKKDDGSLWFPRNHAYKPLFKQKVDWSNENLSCLGIVYGIFGRFNKNNLIVIKQNQFVGTVPGVNGCEDKVYKIRNIAIIRLDETEPSQNELCLDLCSIHGKLNLDDNNSVKSNNSGAVQKTWTSFKSTCNAKASKIGRNKYHLPETKEKNEQRLLNELMKMFNNTDSFYYSYTGDLSSTIQSKHSKTGEHFLAKSDDRFVWNKFMINSLIEGLDISKIKNLSHWITPAIQGFFQSEYCAIDGDDISPGEELKGYQMTLISRRSRFRAGTRYKRRGLDDDGHCANYVETEQIFTYGSHTVSFTQVRGSIPIFWSQPGHSYRPPPRIDRSEEETKRAFELHFNNELKHYKSQVIINLVEQVGRERIIGDAYLNHVLEFNSPYLTYVSFDFHEHCRGMKFENVSVLIDHLKEITAEMKYCWNDVQGLIQSQNGVFRVNCVDCLDRTNIVQTAIARTVMDIQFSKLGVLSPDNELPPNCRRVFQLMWANNGDTISRQYAGTNALKGDFTRTGERRLAGVVKDSYNSASRYYQNRFKDTYRQVTIDIMQGYPVSETDLSSPDGEPEDEEDIDHHERIKQVIEDCKKILIPENEVILGGWPLIDADPITGSPASPIQEMDTVLILTKDRYYVAEYDDQIDRITRYQKVLLEDLERIEFGPEPGVQFFPSITRNKHAYCIRFHYLVNSQSGYFHMFRPTNTRFFNNMAIPLRTAQEAIDSLKAICESFKVALSVKSLNVPMYEGKLEKRKSKTVAFIQKRHRKAHHPIKSKFLPRNISDGNLLNLKNVMVPAFANVSTHFAKFKGKFTGSARSNPHLPLDTLSEQRSETTSLTISNLEAESSDGETYDEEYDDAEEWSEDESIRKLRKIRLMREQQTSIASNVSSVFLSEKTLSSDFSEYSDFEDQDEVLPTFSEEPCSLPVNVSNIETQNDTLLESCGILTISPPLKTESAKNKTKICSKSRSLLHDVDDFVLEAMKKASLRQMHRKASGSMSSLPLQYKSSSQAPSIQVADTRVIDSSGQKVRKLSKSSEDIESSKLDQLSLVNFGNNSASCAAIPGIQDDELEYEAKTLSCLEIVGDKMKTSQSEIAIGQDLSLNLTSCNVSPIVMKKDLILSPLSRIARGVHSFGMNLRSSGHKKESNDSMIKENWNKWLEKKRQCKSTIIEI